MPAPYSAVAALTPITRKKIALATPPISAAPIGSKSRRSAGFQSSQVLPTTSASSAVEREREDAGCRRASPWSSAAS